ncbi:hypothetical protein BDY21DRAFT_369939 [Lineolata rhizophorae]|uniref:Protein transport protein SEC9 n=1 Tax=Lineolata rhizophorae TaxID=578093 RepID=A0A6A6P7Y0_9PEZI|nr:hypothetical protein BDY21DRAFT_369939 [Lineolata rhizophorae]
MKKFGFSKKGDRSGDDASSLSSGPPADDHQRSALFGSRGGKLSKSGSGGAPNPYAQQGASPAGTPDPYSSGGGRPAMRSNPPSYSSAGSSAASGSMDRFWQDKSPVPPGGYGGGGYGPQQGGPGAGYGGSRYGSGGGDAGGPGGPQRSRYGAGGYGGLGRSNSQETMNTEAGREQLFGAAPQRLQQQQVAQQPYTYGRGGGAAGGAGGRYGAAGEEDDQSYSSQGYGGGARYEDRQLTEQEQEDEDVDAAKQEIRFIKQQDVSSTRNALRIAEQAEQTGRDTLGRLGQQGENIHHTERNLDLASNQNRIAEEKARELKTLNKSMFAMHVGNPFTASKRREERDRNIVDTNQREREARDATRAAAWSSQARQQEFARDARGNPIGPGAKKPNLVERSKYQFEADSEDDEMENEIDQNLDMLHGAAGRLKGLAGAMGKEVDEQNKHIDRIIGKTDKVDDQIAMNRARLDRIR